MVYQEISPPSSLARFVRHFWYIEHTCNTGLMTPFRLMADGFPSLIFQYKNQFKDYQNSSSVFPRALLFGHTSNFRDLLIEGDFGVFGVALFPYTLTLLYRLPGADFANNIINASLLFEREDKHLEERIVLADGQEERVRLLTEYLSFRLRNASSSGSQAQHAVQQIILSSGKRRIEAIANDSGISRRQLERQFRQQIGFSPKTFSRIIRFQYTLTHPNVQSAASLTELAFQHGYADQAHFIREFRDFSGSNPKRYFRRQADSAENLMPL